MDESHQMRCEKIMKLMLTTYVLRNADLMQENFNSVPSTIGIKLSFNFHPGSPASFIIIDTSHLEYIDSEKRASKSFDSF
ncbi:hypothetical protein TYRP_003048 [Tyrophagus putrescentiae]|nr:hypothetical protein TYRP_003048 [Tyrophagus putrescentiae]